MKRYYQLTLTAALLVAIGVSSFAAPCSGNNSLACSPCPFDANKQCALQRDILNDIGANGLKYHAPTNYDHRMSGEINMYDATLTGPYTDSVNAPGQLRFLANKVNQGFWRAGEFMTRANSNLPPFNAPVRSNRWTTQESKHGYVEVIVKMPKCDTSSDGLCQSNSQPNSYQAGLWPAIWMMPTNDARWPDNGEIDISEAYLRNSDFKTSTAALHFNGFDGRCQGGDCVGPGFPLPNSIAARALWNDFHIWGFEWEPDPASANGGQLITGYFDNVKVWGPMRTDTLPADGPGALRRGFNDANGGYYLIVNLAIAGPYAGATNTQIQTSSMYVQSAKAYTVNGESASNGGNDGGNNGGGTVCKAPTNIRSTYTQDKRQATITWDAPSDSSPIQHYQVADWENRVIWKGNSANDRSYTDTTLPGTNGDFSYFLSTVCTDGNSGDVPYSVIISLKK